MAAKNAIGSEYVNNTDGWHMIGGNTNKRQLTIISGDVTITGGGGSAVHTFPGSTDTLMGQTTNLAAQSDQETGTSTTTYVSPGRQQFHPSAAKFWADIVGAGTSINASYNVTSITDTGAGDVAITIATDFSSANYAVVASVERNNSTTTVTSDKKVVIKSGTQAAGSVSLQCWDSTATNNVIEDPSSYYVVGFGDQ